MNVLSLCDGIACGRIALERAGIKVNKYYASEINEPSIKVALDNYWCNWEVPSWNDKGILLKDIITDGYVEKDKSWCMLESWNRNDGHIETT